MYEWHIKAVIFNVCSPMSLAMSIYLWNHYYHQGYKIPITFQSFLLPPSSSASSLSSSSSSLLIPFCSSWCWPGALPVAWVLCVELKVLVFRLECEWLPLWSRTLSASVSGVGWLMALWRSTCWCRLLPSLTHSSGKSTLCWPAWIYSGLAPAAGGSSWWLKPLTDFFCPLKSISVTLAPAPPLVEFRSRL